ncbi:hypothetical protein D7316_00288 [Gordonia insulae]|uniref:Aminoglycoside phosphotransferase domain-containing protein n=2 Tax=Gordonia insulae TaxID=2420509 RepID=A0A3G8JGZ6_9ACTN|nr:hypothetical protein D7316_00288 [Gordonia insulae]
MDVAALLGPAGLPVPSLESMLGVPEATVTGIDEVEYDLMALTTGGRWRVGVKTPQGHRCYVVKVARSFALSPILAMIPPDLRDAAIRELPWRIEPDVYRSALHRHMPHGSRLPECHAVVDLDENSAAIWLEFVAHDRSAWTAQRYRDAARLLGRLAASQSIADIADGIGHPGGPGQARMYWAGRLADEFVRSYVDGTAWDDPVVSRHVDAGFRERMSRFIDGAPALLDEIESLPLLSAHGDACPNNLLACDHEFVIIDWAFFSRGRMGFDLSQLVISEIELRKTSPGRLAETQRVCLPAYRAGLVDGGVNVPAAELERAHHIQLAAAHVVSAIPLDLLAAADDADLVPGSTLDLLTADRVAMVRGMLDAIGI